MPIRVLYFVKAANFCFSENGEMTKEQCEQLQEDIITYYDDMPASLVNALCQTVVDWFEEQRE